MGNTFVEKLKAVQLPSGYLGPWPQNLMFDKDVSPSSWGKWDTWGQYHCIYSLYRWYQVTGNTDALEVAIRALDNIYDYFITGNKSIAAQNWAECNLAIGHAFALFYEETGNEKYLAAAERLVNRDWNDPYTDFYTNSKLSCSWMKAALDGKAYYESGQPRWEGLHSLQTLPILWRITGKEEYKTALDNLWWGIYENDRHNTGSFGTGECATGNLYGSGSKTCNTVAWMAFSTDYLAVSRNSRVADELELSFFNATLGSLLEGERNFTYMNDSNGTRKPARRVLENHSYKNARDMSCCQANGNRGLTQITEWALLEDGTDLYLNYYGDSEIVTTLQNGYTVTIRQETIYPKNGNIKIQVKTDFEGELAINLRIPAWSENTVLKLNGQAVNTTPGTYCTIKRIWKNTDTLELTLDMTPHFWVSDETLNASKVSVYTGPVLLAYRSGNGVYANARFNIEDLKSLKPCDGEGIVNFKTVTATGKEVTLTDYYTAGRNGKTFVSWINCPSGITPLKSHRNGPAIWCNR